MKLESNTRKKIHKYVKIKKKKKPQLNNQWIKEEITREFRNYLEINENNNKIYKLHKWVNAVLRGKFLSANAYTIKRKRSQLYKLILNLIQSKKE